MRSEIILGGGGNADQVAAVNQYFASILKPKGTVLYIPSAHPPESWSGCAEWFTGMWSKCSDREAMMLTDLFNPPALENVGGIYIGGGDTNLLMERVCASRFDRFLQLASDVGIPISGGSAGAIVFGKYLWPAPECRPLSINPSGLDLLGLNWCDDLSIGCHYSAADDGFYRQFTDHNKDAVILAIPEEAGIAYGIDAIRVIGRLVVGYGRSKCELTEGTYAKQEVLNMLRAVAVK